MFTGASPVRPGRRRSPRAARRCSGALTALLLGTRNTLYGLRLAPLLRWRGWRRLAAAHVLIDESTAMAVTRTDHRGRPRRLPDHRACRSSSCGTSPPWSARSPATPLGDPRTLGLDAAVGAAFLALLWPRLRDRRNRLVGRRRRGRRARRRCRSRPPACRCSRPRGVALLVGVLGRRHDPDRGPGGPPSDGGTCAIAVLLAGVGCYLLKLAGLSCRRGCWTTRWSSGSRT